ncbi:hypothetical protein KDH_68830 [Dictyobacter sp. S3.2.2.5]|uniref:Anaphase-promoting complex subunit 4 WD40 domain-containing protein n=1 Tax=Dictyobacter halimunensis TaxID=3026934 RepID=A0ABQ6G0N4_9CHLR|nr:hypothetical protein KDH_68830 [Dictyobacter sp. S3.2.2.5]
MKQQIQGRAKPRPGFAQRRKLIAGLTLAGLALNGYAGLKLLGELWEQHINPTALKTMPVDKHRLLSIPGDPSASPYRWLRDGSHLLIVDTQTPNYNIINVISGERVKTLTSAFPYGRRQLYWSSDHRYMVEFGDTQAQSYLNERRAIAWDLQSGKQIWKSPPLGYADSSDLSPEGSYFAQYQDESSSGKQQSKNVQVWDIRQNQLLTSWPVQALRPGPEPEMRFYVRTMAWSPDGTRLSLICSDGAIQVWHVARDQLLWTYTAAATAYTTNAILQQWSPDGKTLLLWQIMAGKSKMHMLNAQTGKLIQQFMVASDIRGLGGTFNLPDQHDQFLAWSNDGARLALRIYNELSGEKSVQIYDAHTGQKLFTCQGVTGMLTSFAWSPDGRFLAAGNIVDGLSSDKGGLTSTIQFWDASTGTALFTYQAPRAPIQLSWSPDSRFLATYNAQDYNVRVGIHYSLFAGFALQVFRVS